MRRSRKPAGALNLLNSWGKGLTPNFDYGQATGMANMLLRLGIISEETAAKWKQQAAATRDAAAGQAQAFGGLDPVAARLGIRLSTIASNAENAKRQIAALLAEGAKASQLSRHGEGEGGLAGEGGEAKKPQVPQMDIGGAGKVDHTARDEAEAESKYEIQLLQQNAQATTDMLNKELAEKKITMSQWLASTKDALADEAQDVQATYEAEMKIVGLTSKQIIDIKREEAAKLKEIAHEMAEAEDKAAKQSAASWKAAGDQVAGIFNSQVDGLLHGTETFAAAFKNMMTSAIEDIIKELIKLAAEAAAVKLLMPAFGGTSLLGGLIPGFAVGAWELPSDTIAQVHAGEMIVPAGPAAGLRSALSGGGVGGATTQHYHIHSNSADPREVAKQVARQWDRNQTMRPSY